jgi:hypothetical protein
MTGQESLIRVNSYAHHLSLASDDNLDCIRQLAV